MDFVEALTEVMDTVKRPDKINVARRRINSAITFYCLDNSFDRDYFEQSLAIDSTQFTQAIALGVLTRFRKMKYMKRGGTTKFLKRIPDNEILKDCNHCDSYYIVGDNININMTVKSSNLDIGYFRYPPILTPDAPNFWLLDIAPWMVIDRACSELFRDIGDDKSMASHSLAARDGYLAARKDLGIANT